MKFLFEYFIDPENPQENLLVALFDFQRWFVFQEGLQEFFGNTEDGYWVFKMDQEMREQVAMALMNGEITPEELEIDMTSEDDEDGS